MVQVLTTFSPFLGSPPTHVLPIYWLNPLHQIFKSTPTTEKGGIGFQPLHTCSGSWRKLNAEPVCFFIVLLLLTALLTCTFIPWLSNSFDLLSYICSESIKRDILRLLLICSESFGRCSALWGGEKWPSRIKGLPEGDLELGGNYGGRLELTSWKN